MEIDIVLSFFIHWRAESHRSIATTLHRHHKSPSHCIDTKSSHYTSWRLILQPGWHSLSSESDHPTPSTLYFESPLLGYNYPAWTEYLASGRFTQPNRKHSSSCLQQGEHLPAILIRVYSHSHSQNPSSTHPSASYLPRSSRKSTTNCWSMGRRIPVNSLLQRYRVSRSFRLVTRSIAKFLMCSILPKKSSSLMAQTSFGFLTALDISIGPNWGLCI